MTTTDDRRNPQIDNVKMISFQQRGDERGDLIVAEGDGMDIPFSIKRVFYMYGSDAEVVRGQHANRQSEFVLINVAGTSKVKVMDGLGNEIEYHLNRPHTGIYIPKMVWKEMYAFSPDSVLLVLSNEHYDESDYIREYDDFLREVRR